MIPAFTIALIASLSPPAEFDYEPTMSYLVIEQPFEQIQRTCEGTFRAGIEVSLGCTSMNAQVIFLPAELEGESRDLILRHEKAHINGWRH